MKKFLVLLCFVLNFSHANEEMLLSSANAFKVVMGSNTTTTSLVNNAKAIIIFPSVKKIGFVVGGMYGEGIAMMKNGLTYNIYKAEISNGSLGFQIGYEDNYMVAFVMTDKLVESMIKSQLTLSADATASIMNASANIGTMDAFTRDIYVYVTKSGVFAGVSLGGSVISINQGVAYGTSSYGGQTLLNYVR